MERMMVGKGTPRLSRDRGLTGKTTVSSRGTKDTLTLKGQGGRLKIHRSKGR